MTVRHSGRADNPREGARVEVGHWRQLPLAELVRLRYVEAVAEIQATGEWAVFNEPASIRSRALLGLGKTEQEAWRDAAQKIKREEGPEVFDRLWAARIPAQRCGTCLHWRVQQYTNPRMEREAARHRIRHGVCEFPDNGHHLTGELFYSSDYTPRGQA